MTAERKDLIAALGQIQNHPAFRHQDIMTITGCGMTDAEVRAHIEANIAHIATFNLRQIEEKAARSNRRRAAYPPHSQRSGAKK